MMDESDPSWTDKCGCLDEAESPKVVRFVELARLVYFTNDKRCAIKAQLSKKLGSGWVEQKSSEGY